ncbi:hypothetical protein WJX73_007531 [Symbiochloris irregularis]|uniref:Uncharacterized protein n=1 Tax=Symbiochloris irregularis TaxID=706552 RepID=A0AAW1PVZ5_9CHLO
MTSGYTSFASGANCANRNTTVLVLPSALPSDSLRQQSPGAGTAGGMNSMYRTGPGYTRPTQASMLRTGGLEAEETLAKADEMAVQDLRSAHEALAHELTRTRSQATLRARTLRDENGRLKVDLATMRERAAGLQWRLDTARRGNMGSTAKMAHELADVQHKLLEEHGKLVMVSSEAQALREKAAKAKAQMVCMMADKKSLDKLLRDEKIAHEQAVARMEAERRRMTDCISRSEDKVASASKRTDKLQRELREARSQIGHMSDGQQLAQARENEHAELLVRFNSLQAKHTGLSEATEDACIQMQKADAALRQREEDVQSLALRLSQAESDAESAADREQELRRRLEACETDLADMRERNLSLLDQLSEAQAVKPLSNSDGDRSLKLAEHAAELERKNLDLQEAQTQVKELERQLTLSRRDCELATAAAASERQAATSARTALQVAQQQAASYRESVKAAEAQSAAATTRANVSSTQHELETSKRIEALRAEMEAQALNLQSPRKLPHHQVPLSPGRTAQFSSMQLPSPMPLKLPLHFDKLPPISPASAGTRVMQSRCSQLASQTGATLAAYANATQKDSNAWTIATSDVSPSIERLRWRERLGI